jgi:hypothetical protein
MLRSFHLTKATLHTASWSSGGKRFFFCEKDIVESTGVPPLKRLRRNPALKNFLQRVDAEK